MEPEMTSSNLKLMPSLQFVSSSPPPLNDAQEDDEEFGIFSSGEMHLETDSTEYHVGYPSDIAVQCQESILHSGVDSEGLIVNSDASEDLSAIPPISNSNKNQQTSLENDSFNHDMMASPPPLDCVFSASFDSLDIPSPTHQHYILEDENEAEYNDFISSSGENCCEALSTAKSDCSPLDINKISNFDNTNSIEPFVNKIDNVSGNVSIPSTSPTLSLQENVDNESHDIVNDHSITNEVFVHPEDKRDTLELISHEENVINSINKPSCFSSAEKDSVNEINASGDSIDCTGDEGAISQKNVAKENDFNIDNEQITKEEEDFGNFSCFQDNPEPLNGAKVHSNFENFAEFQGVSHSENEDGFGDFSGRQEEPDCDIDQMRNLDWLDEEMEEEDFGAFEEGSSGNNLYTKENNNSLTNKFETLILRCVTKGEDTKIAKDQPVCLEQLTSGDAFIWRRLEDIDSSVSLKLSWPNCNAQKLFLGSLSVDARNILFGQKWSSSVPLFAQTLSFSPLTPARPGPGPSQSSTSWSFDLPSLKAESPDMEPKQRLPPVTETEKIIPPAQFDWSSSGLTNPLETPSLEEEIMSGAYGRDRGPPATPKTKLNSSSSLMQSILTRNAKGGISSRRQDTPLESLPEDVKNTISGLPSLSFMRAKVLMFPIMGETQNT